MIPALACICGGVVEIALGTAIFSCVCWVWRKIRKSKKSTCGSSCTHDHKK